MILEKCWYRMPPRCDVSNWFLTFCWVLRLESYQITSPDAPSQPQSWPENRSKQASQPPKQPSGRQAVGGCRQVGLLPQKRSEAHFGFQFASPEPDHAQHTWGFSREIGAHPDLTGDRGGPRSHGSPQRTHFRSPGGPNNRSCCWLAGRARNWIIKLDHKIGS